ncbi:OsmC family protein [Neptunitalea lumnitzerae]|uniref:OsmC-like protein n=1 Tax=Neptunitalea lumnitzerae TaxID=2965509 RepID=A0ABQ5MH21_9FLAO|nr:OsmC family protein [Neptunitalea sp. Y10]GLB48713.1 OsmC-like protein [Neptunitalea sp. Y10]
MKNTVTTKWLGDMKFESDNPSGLNLTIDAGEESGGHGEGYRPKALMLSALAGCSGLDIASLIKKMKLEVEELDIVTNAELTEEHPKYYNKVSIDYNFYGDNLDEKKLKKAVDLSVDKYCGVMEMFRQFAEVTININYKPAKK